MSCDRFFILKCIILFYAVVSVILGAVAVINAIIIFTNGEIGIGFQTLISAIFLMVWAFLGYMGVTKRNRCQLLAFAIILTVSFILSLGVLAVLPTSMYQEHTQLENTLLTRFRIKSEEQLNIFKIVFLVEAVWKIFTGICAYWASYIVRAEQIKSNQGSVRSGGVLL